MEKKKRRRLENHKIQILQKNGMKMVGHSRDTQEFNDRGSTIVIRRNAADPACIFCTRRTKLIGGPSLKRHLTLACILTGFSTSKSRTATLRDLPLRAWMMIKPCRVPFSWRSLTLCIPVLPVRRFALKRA